MSTPIQKYSNPAANAAQEDEPTIAEKGSYIPYIDGLRGLAIFGVLVVHISQYAGNYGVGAFRSHTFESFVNAGARGVQLFFILSAFTLFSSVKNQFSDGEMPVFVFYIKRFFRIFPLWWFAALIYTFAQSMSLDRLVPTLFMYFGFIRDNPENEVIQFGWSIFVEETFYLFLPLVFLCITSLRRAIYFLIVLLTVQFLWIQYAATIGGIPTANNFITLFPLAHWYCFAIGILIYYMMDDRRFASILDNKQNRHLLDIAAIFLVISWLRADLVYPALSLAAVFIAAASEHTIIGRLCRLKVLRRLGAFCYSIYLFHGLILQLLDKVKPAYFQFLSITDSLVEVRFIALAVITLPICYLVGHLSFVYFEKPCVLVGRRIINRMTARSLSSKSQSVAAE